GSRDKDFDDRGAGDRGGRPGGDARSCRAKSSEGEARRGGPANTRAPFAIRSRGAGRRSNGSSDFDGRSKEGNRSDPETSRGGRKSRPRGIVSPAARAHCCVTPQGRGAMGTGGPGVALAGDVSLRPDAGDGSRAFVDA